MHRLPLCAIKKVKFSKQNKFKMKKSILLVLVMFVFYSCQNMETKKEADNQDASHDVELEVLKFTDISEIHYDMMLENQFLIL